MKCQRRISSLFIGAVGLAALGICPALSAQIVDNRPVYYVMLKSLEDAFQAYNAALEGQLNAHASRLAATYQSEQLALSKELEKLDEKRSRDEADFNSRRELLKKKLAAVNEQIALRDGRVNEQRRIERLHSPRYANDPRIKSLKERIAADLANIEAVRASYLSQSNATREARAALTRQIEEYVSAGDPLALEIRSLDEEWHRFAEDERRKLKHMADAYAVDYAAYDKWLSAERAVLEDMSAAVERDQETDREQRALHAETQTALRSLIDEYNALVEKHNKAGADDPRRDARAAKFAALEDEISHLQATLSQARDAVLTVSAEIEEKSRDLSERYERFEREKRERDARLATELAKLDAARLTMAAAIDERRHNVDAQIKSLEAHISAELGGARENLENLNARLVESFGRDHEGFDAAIARVLETGDDALLYTPEGIPRFDISRPLSAKVYTALERLEADRREIDARIAAIEQSHGSVQQQANEPPAAAGALERERAALSNQRQQLLEDFAAAARKIQAQSAALEERRQSIDARFARERAALAAVYSARASVTRSEMQAVQEVLAAAARGTVGTASRTSDHGRLLSALEEKARAMDKPVDPSLLAANPLMDKIAARAPLEGAGRRAGDWVSVSSGQITASRELSGSDKAALAAAWLERLRRQPEFTEMVSALHASGALQDAGQALASLFMAGVLEHTTIVEQQLADGGVGIQVIVLGRDYQLNAGGSLEPFPQR